jgi:hypothetical protein
MNPVNTNKPFLRQGGKELMNQTQFLLDSSPSKKLSTEVSRQIMNDSLSGFGVDNPSTGMMNQSMELYQANDLTINEVESQGQYTPMRHLPAKNINSLPLIK